MTAFLCCRFGCSFAVYPATLRISPLATGGTPGFALFIPGCILHHAFVARSPYALLLPCRAVNVNADAVLERLPLPTPYRRNALRTLVLRARTAVRFYVATLPRARCRAAFVLPLRGAAFTVRELVRVLHERYAAAWTYL